MKNARNIARAIALAETRNATMYAAVLTLFVCMIALIIGLDPPFAAR